MANEIKKVKGFINRQGTIMEFDIPEVEQNTSEVSTCNGNKTIQQAVTQLELMGVLFGLDDQSIAITLSELSPGEFEINTTESGQTFSRLLSTTYNNVFVPVRVNLGENQYLGFYWQNADHSVRRLHVEGLLFDYTTENGWGKASHNLFNDLPHWRKSERITISQSSSSNKYDDSTLCSLSNFSDYYAGLPIRFRSVGGNQDESFLSGRIISVSSGPDKIHTTFSNFGSFPNIYHTNTFDLYILDNLDYILKVDYSPIQYSGNPITSGAVYSALSGKADANHNHDTTYATIDHSHGNSYATASHTHTSADITDKETSSPSDGSTKLITSGAVYSAIQGLSGGQLSLDVSNKIDKKGSGYEDSIAFFDANGDLKKIGSYTKSNFVLKSTFNAAIDRISVLESRIAELTGNLYIGGDVSNTYYTGSIPGYSVTLISGLQPGSYTFSATETGFADPGVNEEIAASSLVFSKVSPTVDPAGDLPLYGSGLRSDILGVCYWSQGSITINETCNVYLVFADAGLLNALCTGPQQFGTVVNGPITETVSDITISRSSNS